MSTNGELWRNSSGWHTTTTPVCDWFGVACDEAGNAISLTLNDNGLNGTLPEELAALQTLTKIDVRGNYLSGDVPQSLATSPTLDTLSAISLPLHTYTDLTHPFSTHMHPFSSRIWSVQTRTQNFVRLEGHFSRKRKQMDTKCDTI
eukprot:TRINITY_DN2789_c0_g1::TRINITY_DN2789_c0_g1_i1::g.27605::m.27605 TRINITY_DN2789_c0_g1::TRINITY_DN2789_c0_g1_i1::g.27605  ORF type:complete len:146 (-),score=7.44,sp/Q9SHI2/Y1723_ARATH/31.52/5e-08,LRR_4/PF12799.2/0.00031,LRR_1/PF00560.28/34,LRR_1/PF00560.28/2,LRR_6/PF13516.1/1.4e+02,LRR_6/PF13516.1/3,LRRNT_2/PF08263.7/0.59,LRRNT_2/PF08263.7/3.8e+03 TRINITY_DN2789_c0_g1_i1:312-749(-)